MRRSSTGPIGHGLVRGRIKGLTQRAGAALAALCLLTVTAMLSGCGSGGESAGGAGAPQGVSSQFVSGVAATGSPLSGEVRLKDSSSPNLEKTTVIGGDGSFAIDVTDMREPFLLKAKGTADGVSYTLHSFADKAGTANINPLSDAVMAAAAEVDDPEQIYENPDPVAIEKLKADLAATMATLQAQIEPLLNLYSVAGADPIKDQFKADHTGLDGMFDNVKITREKGVLTITNLKTGAVIFSGKLRDIKRGHGRFTDDDDNLPRPGSFPRHPENVVATGGDGQITVSWNSVGNATSYNLYWSTSYRSEGYSDNRGRGIKISGVTSPYVHAGLTANTRYYYRVTAVNAAGESEGSDRASATTSAAPAPEPTIPAAPTGVLSTGGTKQVSITWPPVAGATVYNLYWATTSGVTTTTGTKIAGVTSPAVHNNLADSTTYYYILTAANAAGESGPSVQLAATTLTPAPVPTVPAAPTGVSATGGTNQVTVSWSPVFGANSYNVYWATATGVSIATGNKLGGVTSPYVHIGLSAGTGFYYMVTAVNGVGESFASSEASATTAPPPPALPAAPTGVTAVGGAKQVTVSWLSVPTATSYNLYWATRSGVTPTTGTRISGATSPYLQTGLAEGTSYYYVVSAVNNAGEGPTSTQATAATATPPPPPVDGAALYGSTCQGCHGPLASPTRPITARTVTGIRNAGMAFGLADGELQAIINALPALPPPPPPPADGAALYGSNCQACHGPLASPSRPITARTVTGVRNAGMAFGLSDAQLQAIIDVLPALPPPPPPPVDGTALYGNTCQGCHGALASPTRPIAARTVTGIRNAGMAFGLTDPQLQAIIGVLPALPPPPPALDGAALYANTCQRCHGPLATPTRRIRNKTVQGIKSNGMAFGLTDPQLQAIVTVLP